MTELTEAKMVAAAKRLLPKSEALARAEHAHLLSVMAHIEQTGKFPSLPRLKVASQGERMKGSENPFMTDLLAVPPAPDLGAIVRGVSEGLRKKLDAAALEALRAGQDWIEECAVVSDIAYPSTVSKLGSAVAPGSPVPIGFRVIRHADWLKAGRPGDGPAPQCERELFEGDE